MGKIYRMQVEIDTGHEKEITDFMETHGIRTNKEMVNKALKFYITMQKEIDQGKTIFGKDQQGNIVEYKFII